MQGRVSDLLLGRGGGRWPPESFSNPGCFQQGMRRALLRFPYSGRQPRQMRARNNGATSLGSLLPPYKEG